MIYDLHHVEKREVQRAQCHQIWQNRGEQKPLPKRQRLGERAFVLRPFGVLHYSSGIKNPCKFMVRGRAQVR